MPSAIVTSRSGSGSAAAGAGSSSSAAGARPPTNGSGSGLSPRPHNQRPRSHSAAKSSPQKGSEYGSAGGGSSSGKKPHKSNGATGAFASSSSAAAALGGPGASSQHHAHGNGHAMPVFPVSSPDAFDAIVQASNPLHPDHAVWKERFGSLKPPSSRDGHGSGSGSASGELGSEAAANGSAGGSHVAHKHSERLLSPDAEQHSPSSSKLSSSGTRARRSSSNARTRGAALPASTSENSAARRSPSKSLSAASGSAHVHSERHRAQEVLSSLYPPGSPIASGLPATGSSSLNGGGSNFLHLHNNGSGSALGHAFSGGGSEIRRRNSDSSDDHTFAGGTSLGHGADARGGSTVSLLLRPSDGASSSAAAGGSGGVGGSASVPASAQSTPRRRRRREGSASTGGGSRGDSKGKAKALPPPVPPPRIASHPDNNPVGGVGMLPAPSQSSFTAHQNGGASGSGSMAHSSSAFSQASTSASMLPGGGAGALGFPSLHDSNHGSNGGGSSAMVSIPSRSSFTASRSQSIDLPRVQARTSSMLSEADREAVLASVFGQPIPKQPQLPASHGPGPVPASPTSPTGRPRSSSFNSSFNSSFAGSHQADTSTSTIQGDRSNASSVAGVYSVPSNSKAKAGRPTQARHLSTVYQEDTAAEDEFFDANEDEANASLSFTNGSVSPSRQLKTSPLNAPGIPSIRANDGKLLDSERGGKSRSNTDMNSSKYSASFHSMGSSRGTAATTTTGAGAAMLRDMSDQEKREFLAHNSYYIPPASRQSPLGSPSLRGMSSSPHLASSKPHKKSARAMTSASERGSRETRSESTHHSGPPPLPPPPPPPPEEDTSTSSARRPSMWKRLPSFGRRKRTPSDARFAASEDGHSRADSSRSDLAPPSARRDSLVPPVPASAPVAAPPQMRSSPSLNSMSSRPDVSVASTTAPVSASQPPGGPMGPPPVRPPRAAGRPSLSFERPSFLTKDPKKATRDQHPTHLPELVMSAFATAPRDERRTPGLFGSLRNKLSSKSSRAHPPAPLPVGFAAPPAKSPVAGPALSPVPPSPSIAHESTASAEAASSSSPAPWPSSPRTRQAPAPAPRTGPAAETHLQPPKPSEDVRAFDAMLKDFGQAEAQRRRDLVGRARQGLLSETDLPDGMIHTSTSG